MSERKMVRMKADHRELKNNRRYVIPTARAEALEKDGWCDILGDFEEPEPPKVERATPAPETRKAVKAPAKRKARKKKG